MENKKERIFYLDLVRALSAIIIVIFHFNLVANRTGIVGGSELKIKYANGDFGQCGVVLFFIISGAALMYTYRDELVIKEYLIKRVISIYPIFYITYICTFLFNFYINKSIEHSVPKWTFILTILGIDGYLNNTLPNYYQVGTWFLGCIILLYLCFPILRKLLIKRPKTLFVCAVIYYIVIVHTYSFNIRMECNFIARIPDLLFGMYFVQYIKKINFYQFIVALAVTIIMFFVPFTIVRIYRVTILGIALFCVLVYISQFINNKGIQKIIGIISKYSFAIFLIHIIVLRQIILHFEGKILTRSEILCTLVITWIIIAILARCLVKVSSKINKYLIEKLI